MKSVYIPNFFCFYLDPLFYNLNIFHINKNNNKKTLSANNLCYHLIHLHFKLHYYSAFSIYFPYYFFVGTLFFLIYKINDFDRENPLDHNH